jgi:hypothetical protein
VRNDDGLSIDDQQQDNHGFVVRTESELGAIASQMDKTTPIAATTSRSRNDRAAKPTRQWLGSVEQRDRMQWYEKGVQWIDVSERGSLTQWQSSYTTKEDLSLTAHHVRACDNNDPAANVARISMRSQHGLRTQDGRIFRFNALSNAGIDLGRDQKRY